MKKIFFLFCVLLPFVSCTKKLNEPVQLLSAQNCVGLVERRFGKPDGAIVFTKAIDERLRQDLSLENLRKEIPDFMRECETGTYQAHMKCEKFFEQPEPLAQCLAEEFKPVMLPLVQKLYGK